MALADIVVLMNSGRIEQQGSPRDIFNHPRTEFVAKFIGGHNVITVSDETFAVRVDRLSVRRPEDAADGPAISGTISEIEYQGTYVLVAITIDGGTEISAQLSEEKFDASSFSVGDRVVAGFDPARASRLSPRNPATVTSPELVA
jgi:putative spermidine/putrescine transport system ATP-binding protein